MMKKMLLCVGLMGLSFGNVEASSAVNPISGLWVFAKGAAILGSGYYAFTRIQDMLDDMKYNHRQPSTIKEDAQNVLATTCCVASALFVADADPKMIAAVFFSGAVVGGVYTGLKRCQGAENLRLRHFVPAVAACALGREALVALGLPAFKMPSFSSMFTR